MVVLDRGAVPAGWAAAGMLAPQAENLSNSALGALGLYSRSLWPAWAAQLQEWSGQSVDYSPSGILLPATATTATALQNRHPEGEWWERHQVRSRVPGIGPVVTGGLWFEKEACVDNRKVLTALRLAAAVQGVEVRDVAVIGPADAGLSAVLTSEGPVAADAFVLAQGSWSAEWLDLPVRPLKGQMLAIQSTPGRLGTILFGEGLYLVPRRDGRVVVGATQESVDFQPGNTAGGIARLLTGALQWLPELAECQLLEQWWGYRPATPDEAPLLGTGPWPHLFLATGHHRNGILLAPATARLLTEQILTGQVDPLMEAFSYRRFEA